MKNTPPNPPQDLRPTRQEGLMDPHTLAEYLGVSVLTLADHRTRGFGCPYIKIGSAVRYRRSDVDSWLEANTRKGA